LSETLLLIWIALHSRLDRAEHGQTTAEYALVMMAAAAVAGLVLAWATKSHTISRLFDAVIEKVIP
jgi:purine-cytosine permease-like protein